MGALAGDVCRCDQPDTISNEKLTQLELRLLAKLEELAVNPPEAPTDILLGTSYGALLWGMFGNLLVVWLLKITCMISQIVGFNKALYKIRLFKYLSDLQRASTEGGSAAGANSVPDVGIDPSDIHEGAMAVADGLAGNATRENSNSPDIQQKKAEMSCRKQVTQHLSAADIKNVKRKGDDDKLPTHCDTATPASIPTACHEVNPNGPASSPDTSSTIPIPFGMLLPHTTLTGEREKELCIDIIRTLDLPDTRNLSVQTGSTFLSATVSIQPSGMEDLLHRAKCLVKMGSRLDSACTVQLGAAALLYTTSDENVKTILLEQGVYDVPIITSVQRFYTKTIMIKGFYLKDTEIKASISSEKSVCLNVLYYQELDEGLEVLFAQLPQEELLGEKTLFYANKRIYIEGYANSLVLRSIAKKIDIHKHRSTILGTFCKRQSWITLSLLCFYQVMVLKSWDMPRKEWAFQIITLIFSLLLVEYIIGPWTFYIITRCIQYMMRSTNLDNILVLKEISKWNTQAFASSNTLLERTMVTARNSSLKQSKEDDEDDDSGDDDDTDSTESVDEGTVNDENWEWPCYERVFRKWKWVKVRAHAKNESFDMGKRPFELVTTLNPVDGSVRTVKLFVHSTLLIQVLQECEPQTDAHFREGSPIDPKEIFYRREALTAYVHKNSDRMNIAGDNVQLSTSVWHVKHVLRFMERHFAEELEQYERMKAEGCVSYDMLWAFFMPGDAVCRRCLLTNQECFATVRHPAIYATDPPCMIITLNVMDFNVRSYKKCTMRYAVDAFEGEVPFTSLQVCPLHFFPNHKDMEIQFITMGNIFYQVAMQQPFCFRQFKGSLNFYEREGECMRLRKLNADGRVMIDLLSFARMNPDYPLGNAQPPCEVMVGTWTPKPGQMKKPSDEELKMAPAFAYGFSFRLKKWGCFELCGLREIKFNEEAFEALRMKNQNQKAILWSVVQQYTAGESGMQSDNERLDPIANKGRGCIVLCHGPPGTGKTLTAEALAETLNRPLWSISAFELGDEAHKVEKTLGQILEIAHLWRAILLLDEADAYLERRGEGVDVKRNMLTGVFLRVLEYYRGIMFLTTNRVSAFDDAILSRTTLSISYPALDDVQRRAIWEKLLQRHTTIDDATFQALLQHDLNGREIRNIVQLAQILARARGRPLQITDLFSALDASTAGTKDLPHNH